MLRFSVLGIPVGVHFTFLIIALFGPDGTLSGAAIWIFAAFVAVLLHELGHAVTARHYGAVPVQVTLFAMGGVTVYPATEELTPGRRFVIAAAGSTVGIVTGGLVLLLRSQVHEGVLWSFDVLMISYVWAALGWGILNWIPIRPLDGGAMMTSALEIVAPRRGVTVARYLSLVVGLAISGFLYVQLEQTFIALFVLFITFAGFADRSDAVRPARRPGGIVQQPEVVADETIAERDEPDTSFPI